jgi:hypothetical protein
MTAATAVSAAATTDITLAVAEARQQRNSEHDAASATSLVPACGKLQWQPLLQTAEATTSRHRTRRNSGSRKPRQMTSTASLRGNATDTAAVSAITTTMLRLRMNQRSRVDLQSRNPTQQQRLAAASRQQQQRAWTSIDKGKNKKQSVQSKTQVVGSSHRQSAAVSSSQQQSAAVSSSQQQSASAFQHQQLSASSSASADQHHQDQLQRFSTSSSASLQRQQFSTASAAQHQQFSVGSIEHQRQQFSIASAVRRQQFSISSI